MADETQEKVIHPFTIFNFEIEIKVAGVADKVCSAAFSDCDGLEMTMEPKTLRAGGDNFPFIFIGNIADDPAQAGNFRTRFGDIPAHMAADFDLRLQHLRLHLVAKNHRAALQKLCDKRGQFPRLRIDDLVFFLDAYGQIFEVDHGDSP
jgi:hypothetical protein